MPRMIELIRASALPSTRMHAAARGALTVPPAEMIEILVYLANNNKIFGQQARLTLAGWDESAALAVALDSNTPREVLAYMIAPENLRPCLLPALLENPSVTADSIIELASSGSRDIVEIILISRRANQSAPIRNALASNPNLKSAEAAEVTKAVDPLPRKTATKPAQRDAPLEQPTHTQDAEGASAQELAGPEDAMDEELVAYFKEHAAEIAAEADKAFQPIGDIHGDSAGNDSPDNLASSEPASTEAPGTSATSTPAAVAAPAAAVARKPAQAIKKPLLNPDGRRDSTLQKIAKLDVKARIQLAMKGSKEERSILIRDGTKVVALAVLDSPKVTDGEVENFANQKNVLEVVLRGITLKRRFAKNYSVTRNLVFNPRTPLDASLGLMKNLLVQDLKNLSGNKEVSDTIRKLALKMFKQKVDANKKKD
jgi:hypothetical protein